MLSQPYHCTLIQGGLSGGGKKSEEGGEESCRQEEACKEEKISNCSRKFEKGGSNLAFALRYFTVQESKAVSTDPDEGRLI